MVKYHIPKTEQTFVSLKHVFEVIENIRCLSDFQKLTVKESVVSGKKVKMLVAMEARAQ